MKTLTENVNWYAQTCLQNALFANGSSVTAMMKVNGHHIVHNLVQRNLRFIIAPLTKDLMQLINL